MKYIKYLLIALSFFLPTVATAATYGVGWQATTTTNGLIVPNTLNGTTQIPYIDSFKTSNTAATSSVRGNFLISPTGNFPLGFTNGTNFAMYDSYIGPFQQTIVNGSNSNFAISSIYVGNDKYTAAEFASTYYCGLAMGSSNYNIPGFNGLKANGGAIFCKDGPLTVGTGSSTPGSGIYFNAGGLDGNQVSAFLDATTDNFGIGPTTTPTSLLAVHSYPASTRTSLFSIASSTPTATTTLLNFTRDGRMGLSTTTPSATLDIYNGTNVNTGLFVEGGASGVNIAQFSRRSGANTDVKITGSGANPAIVFGANGSDTFGIGYDTVNTGFAFAPGVVGTSNRMIIKDSTGNVGIATNTPRGKLDIYDGASGIGSTASFHVENSGSSGASYVAQMTSGTATGNAFPTFNLTNSGSVILNSQSSFLGYGTNTTITGSGASGRGQLVVTYGATANKWFNLFVDSNGDTYQGSSGVFNIFKTAGGSSNVLTVASSTSGLATTTYLNVAFNGNTSVGTTSNGGGTASQLYVQNTNNNTAIVNFASQTGSSRFTVADGGNATVSGTITADGNNLTLSQAGLTTANGTKIRLGSLTADGTMFHRVSGNVMTLVNSNGTQNIGKFGLGTSTPWALFSISTSSPSSSSKPFFVIASSTTGLSTSTPFIIDGMGEVGIDILNPQNMLVVNGGIQASTTKTKPTCGNVQRGTFWVTQSGAGVKDAVEVCAKDAADAYAWRTIY